MKGREEMPAHFLHEHRQGQGGGKDQLIAQCHSVRSYAVPSLRPLPAQLGRIADRRCLRQIGRSHRDLRGFRHQIDRGRDHAGHRR